MGLAGAQTQQVGTSGSIDWGKRVVIATGIGAPPPNVPLAAARPNALRAAWAVAMRNALETVKGIRVNSTTTVENECTSNDAINTSINGYIKGFQQKGKTRYMSDGSVEVTYEIALEGDLMNSILPSEILDTPSVKSMPKVEMPEAVYSGLVIGCKGLVVTPATAPRVLDEGGKIVYGPSFVSRSWAVKQGAVGYISFPVSGDKIKDRIGDKPLVVKALKISGANNTDAVISNKDADAIRSSNQNLKFLSECRVVFAVDSTR
jgi:hypothetical protein